MIFLDAIIVLTSQKTVPFLIRKQPYTQELYISNFKVYKCGKGKENCNYEKQDTEQVKLRCSNCGFAYDK